MTLNNYNKLAPVYKRSDAKPDKHFSILPTVVKIANNIKNQVVLDLGCGDGFFTKEFAKNGAKIVIGMDDSVEQINLAKQNQLNNTKFMVGNIFKDEFPKADIILAPFVVNYAEDTNQLAEFFKKIYQSLNANGRFIAVVDLPEGKDLKKFGAVKSIIGDKKDGAKIQIQLYNNETLLCTLNAVYFSPSTLENALQEAGFKQIQWHTPIISNKGMQKMGEEFWRNYIETPELGYISGMKKPH